MTSLGNIPAVILAGGFGTRLRPVVNDRPKVLAMVNGRPFLAYILEQLADSGIQHVVLCTGYMGDIVRATFGDQFGTVRLSYSHESSPLGTGGAVRLALPQLESETALIMNGDSLCRANLLALYAFHLARVADATMVLFEMPDTARYGRVEVGPDNRVLSFSEKGWASGPGLVNAGVYLVQRGLLESIPAGQPVSLEYEVFPLWFGRRFFGYQSVESFLDIGTPESYALAEPVIGKEPTASGPKCDRASNPHPSS